MNHRIKELRTKLNMTQKEFASKIGLSRNFITQLETGMKNPSDRTISDICRKFNINESWLRYGNGSMDSIPNNELNNAVSDLLDKNNPLYDSILKIMVSYQKLDEESRSVIDHLITVLISKQKP